MRWPWARPEAAKPVAAPAPKAWESMPTMRPAMPSIQRITDSSAFTSRLTSWQAPGVVGPMEHAVDADAPTGVVNGLVTVLGADRPASTAAGPAPAPTLPERHRSLPTSARPRHVARIVAAEPAPVSTVSPRVAPAATAVNVTPAAEPFGDVAASDLMEPASTSDAPSTPPSALPAGDAVPTLAAPPAAPTIDAGGRAAVGRSGPRPALPVQRTPIDHRSTPGAGAMPAPPAPAPPMRRLGLGAPRSTTDPSSPVVSRLADAPAAPASAAPAPAPAAGAPPVETGGSTGSGATAGLDLALATTAGVTAPAVPTLGAGPVDPAESRATFGAGPTAAVPSGAGSAPTIARLQRVVGPGVPMVAAAPVRAAAPAVPSLVGTAATVATGGAVLQSSAVDGGSSVVSRTSEVGASAALAHGAATPTSGTTVAPDALLRAAPTDPTVRSSVPRSIPTLGAGRAAGISSAPVPASGGGAVVAREVVATGGRPGTIPSGSPSGAARSGPAPTASRLGSSASRPTTAAAAVGPPPPGSDSSGAAPSPGPSAIDSFGDFAGPDVVVSRESDGSVSLTATASPAEHTEVGLGPDPMPVQRETDESVVVSRAADDSAAGGGSAGVPGGAPSDDLDGLARQLYGRLRSELVAELRLDRERAGLGR